MTPALDDETPTAPPQSTRTPARLIGGRPVVADRPHAAVCRTAWSGTPASVGRPGRRDLASLGNAMAPLVSQALAEARRAGPVVICTRLGTKTA